MKKQWQEYWEKIRQYLVYIPIGGLMGLLAGWLNSKSFEINGSLILGFTIPFGFGILISIIVWLVVCAEFAVLTAIHIRYPVIFPIPSHKRLAYGGLGACLGTFLGIWLIHKLQSLLFNQPVSNSNLLPSLATSAIILMFFVLFFAYRFAREDAIELRALMAESRYETLKEQMQPHFLFNSLNSLAELIESRHEFASDVVYKLSNLYRQILVNSNSKTVLLEKEIEIASNYLEIEQVRFGSRLQFKIKIPIEFNKLYIPSLSLQPLIENAIKHGLATTDKTVLITIQVAKLDSMYLLSVSNNGSKSKSPSSNGIGLPNLRSRLELLYGKSSKLEFIANNLEDTTVSFTFSGEKID